MNPLKLFLSFTIFLLLTGSLYSQKPTYIKVEERHSHKSLDSFDVSAYVVMGQNFYFRTNGSTDSNGLVKLYLSPDSTYKINGNWLGSPVNFAYWPAVENMYHFQNDTFILKVDFMTDFGSLRNKYENLYFAFNSDSVIGFYIDKIKDYLPRFTKMLKENPRYQLEVRGHTDSKGSEEYNIKLSQKRADRVKACLVSFGIKPYRIVATSKGKSAPKVPNEKDGKDDPEGRALNRRVEFHIITE